MLIVNATLSPLVVFISNVPFLYELIVPLPAGIDILLPKIVISLFVFEIATAVTITSPVTFDTLMLFPDTTVLVTSTPPIVTVIKDISHPLLAVIVAE